jgi:phosphatidylserine/phosphatidylglycerophosphate/cardiolipin synthase-like enzyme
MVGVTGKAVRDLEQLFLERWLVATGEQLESSPACDDRPCTALDRALTIEASEVGICRTERIDGEPPIKEVLALYERAIAEAEDSIYVETQYFTAGAVRDALLRRMSERKRSRLDVVLVLPLGADTPKERLVLGGAQERLLLELTQHAKSTGHRFRLYCSASTGSEGKQKPTFIHSKVLIVDDRLIAIGSANLTNRSLLLDTELTLVFEDTADRAAATEPSALSRSIARVRAELLGEHAGLSSDQELFPSKGLVARLDELARPGTSRLFPRELDRELAIAEPVLHLEQLFDPDKPLSELELSELLAFGLQDLRAWLKPA